MTVVRAVLILMAILALVEGRLWEAAGIVAFVVVLWIFWRDPDRHGRVFGFVGWRW